jgi:hypothetical protein
MSVFGYCKDNVPDTQRMPTPPLDNFSYIIPVEYVLHAFDKPFCPFDCPCHENELLIGEVAGFVQAGLMTPEEATDFVAGKGI